MNSQPSRPEEGNAKQGRAAAQVSDRGRDVVATWQSQLLQLSHDAIFVWPLSGAIEYWNRGAEELYGYSAEQAVGRVSHELLHTVFPEPLSVIANQLRQGGFWSGELQHTCRDGHQVTVLSNLLMVRGEDGIERILEANRDISERKRDEELLRRANQQLAEANKRKNEFLAVLSHELRNPLAPIKISLYTLNRSAPDSSQAARAKAVIERQVDQLSHLVDDLLDVTRIARSKIRLQVKPVDVNQLVERAVEDHRPLFGKSGVQVHMSLADDHPQVAADPARLMQVVGNLLNNAAKFTPPGGHASVSVSTDRAAEQVVIQVADDGMGMNAETLASLFQPFMQAELTLDRSKGGLGIGLALVKGLVDLHGGRVVVRSDGPGQGTEFMVHLPLRTGEEGPGEPRAP